MFGVKISLYTFWSKHSVSWASLVAPSVKNLPANAGDTRDAGLIPGLERSPGKGK